MKTVEITFDNVYKLIPVCAKWLAENKTLMPIKAEDGTRQIMQWLKEDNVKIWALVDDETEGEPYEGFIAAQCHSYPFWSREIVGEMAWYVAKAARGSGTLLLNEVYKWGQARGAAFVMCNIHLGAGSDNGERACGALEKLGFKLLEKVYYFPIS